MAALPVGTSRGRALRHAVSAATLWRAALKTYPDDLVAQVATAYYLVKRGNDADYEDLLSWWPEALDGLYSVTLQTSTRKPPVNPKTLGQKRYIEAIQTHDVTFGVGPAGTGKTFLAMTLAVIALKEEKVSRIILTRPAVEAGETLGFLPGDLYEKLAPYLRPLHDALQDLLPMEEVQKQMDRGTIEIAPLAYMRGRTLNNAFIILDEAQNSTAEQMLMFLTRLGFNSKAVITGDPTQIDLPPSKTSGIVEAKKTLAKVEGIAICNFEKRDVVRHPLVQRIVQAYDDHRKGGE
ncbi:MAG: PhoH family protein [Verrucomicrobia bacterium]|nr:MAG: PhoH family protein [Verrucomicrobiota bacterium]